MEEKRSNSAWKKAEEIADEFGLPEEAKKEAKDLFERLIKKGLGRDNYFALALAVLFYILRQNGYIGSMKEFIEKTHYIFPGKIRRLYRQILQEKAPLPSLRPEFYLKKLGRIVSDEALNKAIKLARASRGKIPGKNPRIIAAACLYIAAKEGITMEESAELFGITQASIQNYLRFPFFRKFRKEVKYKPVSEEVLSELILKTLKSLDAKQGVPFRQLRRNIRSFFRKELKGFSIPRERLQRVIITLTSQGLIKAIQVPGCQESECPCWWGCKDYKVLLI